MVQLHIKGYPELSLLHLRRLTDSFGIIQHSKYGIPDKKTGYTTDDNARALLAVLRCWDITKDEELLELARIYMGFLWYVLRDDGWVHNFVSYDRKFLDDIGSEDSFGRTFLSCAYAYKFAPVDIALCAKEILDRMSVNIEKIRSPRAICFILAGSSLYPEKQEIISSLVDKILSLYYHNVSDDWRWIEPYLTYDNGIIPRGLFSAYSLFKEENYLSVAIDLMDFLGDYSFKDGIFIPPGNEKWELNANRDGRPIFDQQPLEVSSFVEACKDAFYITKNEKYLLWARSAFDWFFGRNIIGEEVYDSNLKACRDGISRYGLNLNMGAESILSYILAYISIYEILIDQSLRVSLGGEMDESIYSSWRKGNKIVASI